MTRKRWSVLLAALLLLLGLTPAQPANAAVVPLRAVFIGDSYTQVAMQPVRWSLLLSQQMGWTELNIAYGASGYVTPVAPIFGPIVCGQPTCPPYADRVGEIAALDPDIVIVAGGRNDIFADPTLFYNRVIQFYADVNAAVPDAAIYATTPIWDDDPVPPRINEMQVPILLGVATTGSCFVDLQHPFLGHPEYIGPDGVHPNDAGHAAMKDAFVAAAPAYSTCINRTWTTPQREAEPGVTAIEGRTKGRTRG